MFSPTRGKIEETMNIVEWDSLSAATESTHALPSQLLVGPESRPAAPAVVIQPGEYSPPLADNGGLTMPGVPLRQMDLPHAPELDGEEDDDNAELPMVKPVTNRALHRLAEVREQQGVTLRNMARRMGCDVKTIRAQEHPRSDISLSVLYAWQQVLEVPVMELLVDDDAPLSAPVMKRAQLVKLMKTAAAIQEKADNNSIRRLVAMLMEQLQEIMPELKDVGPWHTVGQRRTLDDYGRVAEQPISDDVFRHGVM
ncbi:MAG: helix-turn-helix transcriptional regulator [Pirellulales bacterium]|nr:helix-turn-helix transcriptional regulator [Pirellulales bacterium]